MGAKLKAVRTELILLGLTAVFLGGLLTVSYRDRTTATVTVTAEHALPPEEVEVTLVDLNTAEAEELATLPGIGEGLVDYRTEHGPFEGPEGLMEVSGIGEKKLEELRDYITVSDGA
mgnify:CR=1 FL=1